MKRICIFIIVAFLSLSLVSCGSDKGKEKTKEDGGEKVFVYSFGDYIDPDLVSEFEDKTGIEVVMDTFDTAEEMYPVISKGTVLYDVICTSDYMIQRLAEEGKLYQLNKGNIENISNIDEKYMKIAEEFDPGNKYSVPHTWGTLGIIYNTDHIKEGEISSWKDLWNKKYKGQIVMPDSMRDTLAIALKAKGYSINTTDEKEIGEAADYLKKQKDLVYKYANDAARDMAIGGSCDIAVVWNGEAIYSQEENDALEFVIPEEGTEEFIDAWAIPKNAENKANAEKWINFMLEKESAIKNYDYLTYSIPNKYVIDYVSDDKKVMSYLFPPDDLLESCETLKSLGVDAIDIYSRYWKDFKAE